MREYKVLQDLYLYRLVETVNKHLDEGFIVVGGPFIHTPQDYAYQTVYAQAVVKNKRIKREVLP